MKFKFAIAAVCAVVVALVVVTNAQAATAPIPQTSQIQAVKQATARYGWPHNRTLAETVGIPLTVRYDLNRYLKDQTDQRHNWHVGPVTCRWRNSRVLKPMGCNTQIINRRGQVIADGSIRITTIWEDGSYAGLIS